MAKIPMFIDLVFYYLTILNSSLLYIVMVRLIPHSPLLHLDSLIILNLQYCVQIYPMITN